jgi:hypothetical protein
LLARQRRHRGVPTPSPLAHDRTLAIPPEPRVRFRAV